MSYQIKYTHTGIILGVGEKTKGKDYKSPLRKFGKYWVTPENRRFNRKTGNEPEPRWAGYDWWRLDISSVNLK